MKLPAKRDHKCIERLADMLRTGQIEAQPGKISHVTIRHDDTCAIWKGGECDCDPEIVLGQPSEARHD